MIFKYLKPEYRKEVMIMLFICIAGFSISLTLFIMCIYEEVFLESIIMQAQNT